MDHALEPEQEVSTSYDPMLGKVIAWGADREAARATLVAALDETAILGITTNTGFLRALAASDEFRDTTIDTAWLDRHEVPAPDAELARVFAAWTEVLLDTLPDSRQGGSGPWHADGWRMGADPAPDTVDPRRRPRGRRPPPRPGRPADAATTYAWCRPPTTPSTSSSTAAPSTPCSTCSATSSTSCTGAALVVAAARPVRRPGGRGRRRHAARADARHRPRGQRRARARPWRRVRRWA